MGGVDKGISQHPPNFPVQNFLGNELKGLGDWASGSITPKPRHQLHDEYGNIDDQEPSANLAAHCEPIQVTRSFFAVVIAVVNAHESPSPGQVLSSFYHTGGVEGRARMAMSRPIRNWLIRRGCPQPIS